jgi:hypothetical protein
MRISLDVIKKPRKKGEQDKQDRRGGGRIRFAGRIKKNFILPPPRRPAREADPVFFLDSLSVDFIT